MTDQLEGSDPVPASPVIPPLDGKHVAHDLGPLATPAPAEPVTDHTALTDRAQQLVTEVHGLRDAAAALTRRLRRNEWAVRLTVAGLIADVALSLIALFVLVRLETSIHEQCTLDSLILPSYSDAAKQRSPLGPQAYDDAYRRIQVSADHLGCGIRHIKELG